MPDSFLAADGNDQMLLADRRTLVAKPNAPRGTHPEVPSMRGSGQDEASIFAGFHGNGAVTVDLASSDMLGADPGTEAPVAAAPAPAAAPFLVPALVLLALGGLFLAVRKA
jgi:hypothetical protein